MSAGPKPNATAAIAETSIEEQHATVRREIGGDRVGLGEPQQEFRRPQRDEQGPGATSAAASMALSTNS